jgi:hypothetical protein
MARGLLQRLVGARAPVAAWRAHDRELRRLFADPDAPAVARYEFLFRYFVSGFLAYRTPARSGARYPGAPSKNGAQADDLEGFSRIAPLIAAWLAGGRAPLVDTLDGVSIDLAGLLADGFAAGADPASSGYWGDIGHRDQRIVEAADIALAAWLARDSAWRALDEPGRRRLAGWLGQCAGRQVWDNNWHQFPVVVGLALGALGAAPDRDEIARHYVAFKSYYRGDGWFSDGPRDRFDYYNAWAMHYAQFWVGRLAPGFDDAFILKTLGACLETFACFISPAGVPITGRSVCYRMALPAPLILGALGEPTLVNPGLARRALDAVWRHFIAHGAIANGVATQGYCGTDLRWLDNYSGPASSLWSLRSLIPAFYAPESHPLWTAPEQPLPVETADFAVDIPAIGWRLVGDQATGDVVLHRLGNRANRGAAPGAGVEDYRPWRRLRDGLSGRAHRPMNEFAKYELFVYGSRDPFCGCRNHPLLGAAGARRDR